MPAGIPITAGYDSIHPFGMRGPSGVEWEFPGTTHFLGRDDESAPAGWPVVWSEGDWRLWENPAPSMGVGSRRGGAEQVVLLPRDVQRPTHNTMQVTVPAGATDLKVFSNWHRGWEWRTRPDDPWRKVGLGENRTLKIEFAQPSSKRETIDLRYNPTPPLWVLGVSFFSLMSVALIGLLSRESGTASNLKAGATADMRR
jgi:hypothetical protein